MPMMASKINVRPTILRKETNLKKFLGKRLYFLKLKLENISSEQIGCFTGDLTNTETAYAAKVFNKVFKSI